MRRLLSMFQQFTLAFFTALCLYRKLVEELSHSFAKPFGTLIFILFV